MYAFCRHRANAGFLEALALVVHQSGVFVPSLSLIVLQTYFLYTWKSSPNDVSIHARLAAALSRSQGSSHRRRWYKHAAHGRHLRRRRTADISFHRCGSMGRSVSGLVHRHHFLVVLDALNLPFKHFFACQLGFGCNRCVLLGLRDSLERAAR